MGRPGLHGFYRETAKAVIGKWQLEYVLSEGGRITRLKFDDTELLNTKPETFTAPLKFYGEYETRPVFGYDDCFPTVDSCTYPEEKFIIRDHGELCWQQWQLEATRQRYIFSTHCLNPGATFKRILDFGEEVLTWIFEVTNNTAKALPFLHVMHPLMPLKEIRTLELPGFDKVINEVNGHELALTHKEGVINYLLSVNPGCFEMLLLQKISSGSVRVGFRSGLNLHICFDPVLFPTLGIWWNHAGYPDEKGHRRIESAFEPIPGTCSNLEVSHRDGDFMTVEPGETIRWAITWTMSEENPLTRE